MGRIMKSAAALLLIAFGTGCAGENINQKLYTGGFIAMDTYISLTLYGESGEKASAECKKEIERLEAMFSVTDENSEISLINNAQGAKTTVSAETAELIDFALKAGDISGGCLDITVYPVVREWGFTTGEYKVPDPDSLSELLKNTGYEKVILENNALTLPPDGKIDLGAVAKGYAGDKAIEILKNNGIVSGLISLGGNIQTIGGKPDGTPWNVAVRDPFSEDNFGILKIKDRAIVTSGNYERFFEENGKIYHHIIDPSDGYPADNGIVSATVIGDKGALCDALSTAVFVMGTEKSEELWRSRGDFEMILVTDEKEIFITEGIYDSFENTSDMEMKVIYKKQ